MLVLVLVLVLVLETGRTWAQQASALIHSTLVVFRFATPADFARAVDYEHEHRDAEHEYGERARIKWFTKEKLRHTSGDQNRLIVPDFSSGCRP